MKTLLALALVIAFVTAANDEFKLETLKEGDSWNYPQQGDTVEIHYTGKV